jgi:hypothetical protein
MILVLSRIEYYDIFRDRVKVMCAAKVSRLDR